MSDTEQSAYRRAGGADMTPTAHERAGKIANDFFLIKPIAPLIAAIERAIEEAEAAARKEAERQCAAMREAIKEVCDRLDHALNLLGPRNGKHWQFIMQSRAAIDVLDDALAAAKEAEDKLREWKWEIERRDDIINCEASLRKQAEQRCAAMREALADIRGRLLNQGENRVLRAIELAEAALAAAKEE